MSVYFVISVLIIFLIILLIVLTITNKIVISRKKTVYLSLIALFFAFFIKSAAVEKNEQIKNQVLEMVPTLKAINQVDPGVFEAFFTDYKKAGSGSKKREEHYMRVQQWATANLKKLLYLAGDDAVINYGKMRLEFLQKALEQDTSGDFCFRVLHPQVSGPPDMKITTAEYRDFVISNRAVLELVNSAGEGAPVAHYSADEIQSLFSAQIQESADKYGDRFLTDDPYILAEDKLQTCQMEIDLMADVLRAPPRESAELIRYVFADEWPE
ncbi:hypothetical protein [Morganella morganii]|uniref:hypothetical protein n=1 Tax=Morganella morganii TaxID=582 RepID=UPI0031A03806